MARGMVIGEPIVSQAQTKAYDEGYERAGLGKSETARERGRFVWDPAQQKLVRPWEKAEALAKDAPVMAGRFYENVGLTDGTVIRNRQEYHEYMAAHGLAPASEFTQHLAEKRKERDRFYTEGFATAAEEKRQKDAADRALGEIVEMRQKDYDKLAARREADRKQRGRGFTP